MDGSAIKEARLALGGVAHKPWRDAEAEAMLNRKRGDQESFQKAAEAILRDAKASAITTSKLNWRNAPSFALCGRPRKWEEV